MKVYHNKTGTLGFTRMLKGYEKEYNLKHTAPLKASIGIDVKLLRKALNKLSPKFDFIELQIRQIKGYTKALYLNDSNNKAVLAEYILPVWWTKDLIARCIDYTIYMKELPFDKEQLKLLEKAELEMLRK